jgi:hypothetical protein
MKTILLAAAALSALSISTALAQRGGEESQTRDQFIARQMERFKEMDANQDGVVTKDELAAAMAARMGRTPSPERVDMMFKMIDADGDGKATAAEAQAAAGARFDMMDANHDGTLTPEERRAGMMGMMMGRH